MDNILLEKALEMPPIESVSYQIDKIKRYPILYGLSLMCIENHGIGSRE